MQNCSRLDIFKKFKKDCPNVLRAEDGLLYFPIYSGLRNAELMYMVNVVKQVLR